MYSKGRGGDISINKVIKVIINDIFGLFFIAVSQYFYKNALIGGGGRGNIYFLHTLIALNKNLSLKMVFKI